jgi:hypothetical protein
MGIDDLDPEPLLLYFQKLESYLEELGQLEPIKASRHVVRSTSTPSPSTATIMTKSSNYTNLPVNSTVASVEQNSKSETETETIVLFGYGALAAIIVIVVVVGTFMVCHQCFSRSHIYSQATTQES